MATQLFVLSAADAASNAKQTSSYVFAGLPLLFSALRALLIECNSGAFGSNREPSVVERLAQDPNELALLRDHYAISHPLADELALLYEVRNELVHPAHRPAGTPDQTPDYLRPLKVAGLLVSTGDPQSDYPFTAQLQSHALFRFAFTKIEQTVAAVLAFHASRDAHFECRFLSAYQHYKIF